ncbi:MAG TPA: dienelactone hydrolase family protein [Candidatus Limnocylindrales bacterium]|nr:dienelactone hydrolase family protein [Candidatus Limnocylindrales bacterium]
MCYDLHARPPLPPIRGAAVDAGPVSLTAADGVQLAAYAARAEAPGGAGMVVLPDVRGLHPFFEELALRFAEAGISAVAIDYFSRTAGAGTRGEGFDYAAHVPQTRFGTLNMDVAAAVDHLRSAEGGAAERIYTVGFCFGGRLSFLQATTGQGLAGVIGFYGWPVGTNSAGLPAPADVADRFECPVLALWGGADRGIGSDAITRFGDALATAGVTHRSVVYPDAPHSFFDRRAVEHAAASEDAWRQVLDFIQAGPDF